MRRGRHVRADDPPRARCGRREHGSYNPYRHGRCPGCHVADGGYHLGCENCGYDWLADEGPTAAECPRCDADARFVAELRSPPR